MTHVGQEVALGAIGDFCGLLGNGERLLVLLQLLNQGFEGVPRYRGGRKLVGGAVEAIGQEIKFKYASTWRPNLAPSRAVGLNGDTHGVERSKNVAVKIKTSRSGEQQDRQGAQDQQPERLLDGQTLLLDSLVMQRFDRRREIQQHRSQRGQIHVSRTGCRILTHDGEQFVAPGQKAPRLGNIGDRADAGNSVEILTDQRQIAQPLFDVNRVDFTIIDQRHLLGGIADDMLGTTGKFLAGLQVRVGAMDQQTTDDDGDEYQAGNAAI